MMDGGMQVHTGDYEREIAAWKADAAAYWLKAADVVSWIEPPSTACSLRPDGTAAWYPDGMLNTCFNALDRHVAAGRGEQAALIWESPATGARLRLSYAALLDRVARVAGGLRDLGVRKGGRVVICLPPVPECVIAMLACARLGAVHVVTFAGFAATELARRIRDVSPDAVITATGACRGTRPVPLLPAVREALALSPGLSPARVVLSRPSLPLPLAVGEVEFSALEQASPVPPVPVAAGDPLYILHTSGTTGNPKGVVRDNGGHAVAIARSMRLVYGLEPGEVFFTTADPGWVVGHSYGVYGPLFVGATAVLFEGGAVGTPDAGEIWRICARNDVAVLFTAPTVLRAMRQEDPGHRLVPKMPALRRIFLAGERMDAPSAAWAQQATGVPVLDHWWQTETGSAIVGHFAGLGDREAAQGAVGRPAPGFLLCVLDDAGRELPRGAYGEIAVRLPLPPGCLSGLWQGEAPYFAHGGYYRTFDYGAVLADGSVTITARTDDVLKVAGRRIGAGVIEDVLAAHPDVVECAVAGQPHPLRGEVPVAFVVPRGGAGPDLPADLVRLVRERVGAFAGLRRVRLVATLPRTRSGKIIRRGLVADQAD
jgi:propionyl-CoA synthetase